MYTILAIVFSVFSLTLAGYLPPENDSGYESRSCGCDMSAIEERLSRLEEQNTQYRNQLDALHRQKRQATEIFAFSAYLSQSLLGLNQGDVVKYDKTLLNEGSAYDPATGKFTAPVDGIYMFSFIIETKHQTDVAVKLVIDGVNELDAVVEPEHNEQNLQGGNVGLVKMTEGQKAWVSVYNTDGQWLEGADTYRFTTFAGVLLHPMLGSGAGAVVG